jgi:coiled-coil domain-containing protein 61
MESQQSISVSEDFLEQEWKQEFHGTSYIILLRMNGPMLTIEAEQEDTNERWFGEFTGQYVEEITHKAGSYKKFPIFVKMLCSAFNKESPSVFVELLTYSDLELMKARKMGHPDPKPRTLVDPTNKAHLKRYVILTYQGEFDRVHYPLPLAFEEVPNTDSLLRTIKRLRLQIDMNKPMSVLAGSGTSYDDGHGHSHNDTTFMSHSTGFDDPPSSTQARNMITNLRKENTELRHRLRQAEARLTQASKPKDLFTSTSPNTHEYPRQSQVPETLAELAKMKKQHEATKKDLQDMSIAYDRLRAQSTKEINRWKNIYSDGGTADSGVDVAGSGSNSSGLKELRRRVVSLEQELDHERIAHKKTITSHRREISDMLRSRTPQYNRMNAKWRDTKSSGYGTSNMGSGRSSSTRPTSKERSRESSGSGFVSDSSHTKSRTRVVSGVYGRTATTTATTAKTTPRGRGRSTKSRPGYSSLSPSRPNGADGSGSGSNTKGYRSSSLGGRFDPTAYQKEKQRRLSVARSKDRPGWGSGNGGDTPTRSSRTSPSPSRNTTPSSIGGASRAGTKTVSGRYGEIIRSSSRKSSRGTKSGYASGYSSTEGEKENYRQVRRGTRSNGNGTVRMSKSASGTVKVNGSLKSQVQGTGLSKRPESAHTITKNTDAAPAPLFPKNIGKDTTKNITPTKNVSKSSATIDATSGITPVRAAAAATLSSLKQDIAVVSLEATTTTSESEDHNNQPAAITSDISGQSPSSPTMEISEIDKKILALQSFLDNARDKFSHRASPSQSSSK